MPSGKRAKETNESLAKRAGNFHCQKTVCLK